MLHRFHLIVLVALVGILGQAGQKAGANDKQKKSFAIAGIGVGPNGLPLPGQEPRSHWIIGVASYLGLHVGEGTVRTDNASPQANGTITGEFGSGDPFVFVGANGDKLVCYYGRTDQGADNPGTFVLTPVTDGSDGMFTAAWIAEFVVVSDASTGTFKNVEGSWIMYAYSAPFLLGSSEPIVYWWEGHGTLEFPKPKKKK